MLAVIIELMTVANEKVVGGHVVLFGFFYFLLELSFPTSLPSRAAAFLFAPALVLDVCASVHVLRGKGIAQKDVTNGSVGCCHVVGLSLF